MAYSGPFSGLRLCSRCQAVHGKGECQAKTVMCTMCNRIGHFSHCCKNNSESLESSKKGQQNYRNPSTQRRCLGMSRDSCRIKEENHLCRLFYASINESYGEDVSGEEVHKRLERMRRTLNERNRIKFNCLQLSEPPQPEVDSSFSNMVVDPPFPAWFNLPKLEGGFVCYKKPKLLSEITQLGALIEKPSKYAPFKIAPSSFSESSDYLAFYGQDLSRERWYSIVVDVIFKETVPVDKSDRKAKNYKLASERSMIAVYFCDLFNHRLSNLNTDVNFGMPDLKFLKIKTLRYVFKENNEDKGIARVLCCEKNYHTRKKFIKIMTHGRMSLSQEDMRKYDIDGRLVEKLEAFSHFTYQESQSYLVILDYSGAVLFSEKDEAKTLLLTDSAIYSTAVIRFGKTNGGLHGIQHFKIHHKCNNFCEALKLTAFLNEP